MSLIVVRLGGTKKQSKRELSPIWHGPPQSRFANVNIANQFSNHQKSRVNLDAKIQISCSWLFNWHPFWALKTKSKLLCSNLRPFCKQILVLPSGSYLFWFCLLGHLSSHVLKDFGLDHLQLQSLSSSIWRLLTFCCYVTFVWNYFVCDQRLARAVIGCGQILCLP